MEVLHRSATRLVLRDRPWLESAAGVAFVAAGILFLLRRAEGPRPLLALLLAVGLVLLLVVARVVTCTFDREAGLFTREYRSLLRRSSLHEPLSAIAGVRVARQRGSKGSTYRVDLALRSGGTVPLTPFSSSGEADKRRVAAVVRDFLGLPATAADTPLGVAEATSILLGRGDAGA